MEKKVLTTDSDYTAALTAVEGLMDLDPDPGTPEAEELELLTVLIQDYESKHFRKSLPDPISAIRFRMEQQGLSPRDLVPYLGSRSKVSEVLSAKRPLTLSMIRSLHTGLGIPAKVLLQTPIAESEESSENIRWERFPIREMIARGWIQAKLPDLTIKGKELIEQFFAQIGSPSAVVARYLKIDHIRSTRKMDRYALAAWSAQILVRAEERSSGNFRADSVDVDFMREVARLSWSEKGPLLAQEFLEKHGVLLVIEPHLPKTYLDGAVMMTQKGEPVIGLTVRYDRLDNFWFALMHELAHVSKHLLDGEHYFFDDLEAPSQDDAKEKEADELAGEALIPRAEWLKSPARLVRSPENAQRLAQALRIHPAIIAGRMRYEAKNFRILNQMIGLGQVRRLFPGVQWPEEEA